MYHALSIKHCAILILTLLAITSCGGRKGELRIRGEIRGLNQASLTVFSRDGIIQGIDTLHVINGEIDWTCPCDKESGSLTIVYPTYSTLTVFGGSGDVIRIEGDAKQLGSTRVSGTPENEEYTLLREQMDRATPEGRDSIIEAYVGQHPQSPVSQHLHIEELAGQVPAALRRGERLPDFALPLRNGDTLTTDSLHGRYTLMAFWANWRGGTGTLNTRIRRLRRQAVRPLECISYNMDVNATILDYIERTDSITWPSYGDRQAFQSPLASRLGIRDIPYYILTDTACHIITAGSDWQKDIEPHLPRLTQSDQSGQSGQQPN